MIIDFEHHFAPLSLARQHGYHPGAHTDVVADHQYKRVTLHDRYVDLEWHVRDMDEAGIDIGALSSALGLDASVEECRIVNDDIHENMKRFPGRFTGFIHLPLHDEKQALKELDRGVYELGLPAVTIGSQVNGRTMDDRSLFFFYQRVQELNLPIFVNGARSVRGYECLKDYDLGRIIGREFDLITAIVRVVAGGVLDAYPDLKFVFGHFGGGLPTFLQRVGKRTHRFGVSLKRDFEDYIRRMSFNTAGTEGGMVAFHCGLEVFTPQQLLFATDYPQNFTSTLTNTQVGINGIAEYISNIRALPLSNEDISGILGHNAAKLLGIAMPPNSHPLGQPI